MAIEFFCFYLAAGFVVALAIDLDSVLLDFFQWIEIEGKMKEFRHEAGEFADKFMLASLLLFVVLAWPVVLWSEM